MAVAGIATMLVDGMMIVVMTVMVRMVTMMMVMFVMRMMVLDSLPERGGRDFKL